MVKISEKMREMFREYPKEMEYLFDQFIAEMNDIADNILENLPLISFMKNIYEILI